ncbi:hypothetical protein CLOM_g22607 [Closterium sp. NIES-68]|nr:hypothetical protein CLOM_g22607 [Closterium sp. NIES-68]GJP76186.1 hypothetical protein CLOP_g6557 [Closterium sp. NIES-67]
MAPLSTSASDSSDSPPLSASAAPSANDVLPDSVINVSVGLPAAQANGFIHSAPPLPESTPASSAMPYLPPRQSTASAAISAVSMKPSPPTTDAFPSGSPRGDSTTAGEIDYSQLPSDLDPSRLPGHVAIILDGNSRWAKRRGMPKELGHEAGLTALRETVRKCGEWGIRALTVFAFSTENWGRPKAEVDFLMALLGRMIDEELDELHKQRVAVRVIGDPSRLIPQLQRKIEKAQSRTQDNDGLRLSVAINYSGRQDIVHACRRIAERVAAGEIQPDQVSEALLTEEMGTSWLGPDLANPDLLIRTSGEQRLSNFLLWQSAYTELYFCDTLWPDFGAPQLHAALLDYQQRDRRFGKRNESS